MLRDDCQRIARTHEEVFPEDHIAIAVSIACSSKIRSVWRSHPLHEISSMHEIGIGMVAAEILERNAVNDCAFRRSQTPFQDVSSVGPGYAMHCVEHDPETVPKQLLQGLEIKQFFHHRSIVGKRVDDGDLRVANGARTLAVEIDFGMLCIEIMRYRQGVAIDAFCKSFGRGASVVNVVFDSEVLIRAARIVTGGKKKSSQRSALSDDGGHGRS